MLSSRLRRQQLQAGTSLTSRVIFGERSLWIKENLLDETKFENCSLDKYVNLGSVRMFGDDSTDIIHGFTNSD